MRERVYHFSHKWRWVFIIMPRLGIWDEDGEGLYNWDGNGLGVPYPKLALLPSLRAPLLGQWVIKAKICTLMACV